MMTNEELVAKIQDGESCLIEQLWRQCYGFIRQQAIRWGRAWESRPDFDVDDLTQAGYIALCEAVKGYEKERGGFLGFLLFYLKTEFAKVAGCRTEAQMKEPLNCAVSLDAPAYNDSDGDLTFGESIPVDDQGFEEVEAAMFNQQLSTILEQAMNDLSEDRRRVIDLYFLHGLTQDRIAGIINRTTGRTGQMVKEGLASMKKGRFAPALSEMLYGDRNYYLHTGYSSWKYSGSSSPEWELLKKESRKRRRMIRYCIEELGMSEERAKKIFPA